MRRDEQYIRRRVLDMVGEGGGNQSKGRQIACLDLLEDEVLDRNG